ncbi:hypothetical protein [Cylindrospermum sp. FACHB-282]|uniref:hypothetical protein n=1 Tax=Cylindrospermum sp. FACHB-282 TaxID=2692794 RepID=UPI001681FA12|nr:hypothetical protein [Cylindrospermum sp. FACHB-282]MBD2383991.1 hypothetical protein [Cylindrospermum sp. FACHB-282]
MAPKNNLLGDLLSSSPNFFSQLLFGLLLIIISSMAGASPSLSLFLGIMGGFALGWFTTATENSPQPPTIGSSDGIDAGLKYWLIFIVGFVFLGYPTEMSILLGGIAGLGGGWMIAWWKSKEETRTQLPVETLEETESQQQNERTTRQSKRRSTRRYRRTSGFNFRFWER